MEKLLLSSNFGSLGVPIKIDTDVNASCIGEITFGSAKGLSNVVYVTIGTGIGAGICAEHKMIHGILLKLVMFSKLKEVMIKENQIVLSIRTA